MKPKIAVVRGHYFSKDELSFYRPLAGAFDITFFSSVRGTADTGTGIDVIELPCLDGIINRISFGSFKKVYGSVSNLAGIEPEIIIGLERRLKGFDIVHSVDYDYLLSYQLARLKKKLGFRLVTIHWENIPFARDRQPIARYFKYRTYSEIDGFLATSERAKASLLMEGVDASRIFVTYYAVDTDKFKPDRVAGRAWRKKYGISDDDFVILFIGRVRASKGVFELIYATRKLLTDPEIDRTRIKLVIVGKGPGEQQVSKITEKLGLKENVVQIGYIPHNDIPNIHNMADAFCGPSVPRKYWQEQLGLVFLEAMACGVPVISTFSGSIPEVIGDAGVLVQPNDHQSLFEALREIVRSADLRQALSKKGRERAVRYFSRETISVSIQEAYRKILTGSNAD